MKPISSHACRTCSTTAARSASEPPRNGAKSITGTGPADVVSAADRAATEAAITPQTKAILAVNLFGHAAQLQELEAIATKHNLVLLEDNSQSPGATIGNRMVGTVGRMAAQSLNYHKAIQTGEGGVVLTNDDRDALHLQLIRNHGEVVIGSWM